MYSPCASRTIVADSWPCSTRSRSRRWRPRQMRLVIQNAKTGATKNSTRNAQVMSLRDISKCVAMRSFAPASTRMKKPVTIATPAAVRVGEGHRGVRRDGVVRTREHKDEDDRHDGDARSGAGRGVARTVEHVVLALLTRRVGLEEGPGPEHREQQARDDDRRDQHVEREG